MGLRQFIIDVLQAGRAKNEPDRETDIYPFPFGFLSGWGTNQPAMKRTQANLRLLSESGIPRRAINVIKDGIAKLEWSVGAIDDKDQEKMADASKIISNVLRKPNQSDSFRLWIEQIVEDMLVCSAGATEIVKAGDPQRPLRMFPVDAFSIELYPDWDGKRDSYRYAQRKAKGSYVDLTDSELMYIRRNPRSNTPFGLSELETVWESVNHFISSHKSAGKQAGNSFVRKILNLGKGTDGKGVSNNTIAAYRTYWEQEVQGKGVMPIISGDTPSVLDLGATDDKALFIEWQRFLIEVIAISFGISPKKLGQTKDVNKSTADSEDDDTNATIQTIADTVAEHINNEIIDGYFKMGHLIQFKFKYATSMKDKKTQAEIDDIYVKNGTYLLDEVRDSLGKKPHLNKLGEVIQFPNLSRVIDVNKTLEEQTPAPVDPNATDPKKKANLTAKDATDTQKGTDDEEEKWKEAYFDIMLSLLSLTDNVSSISTMGSLLIPSQADIDSLTDALTELKSKAWLSSYNRRRVEMGSEKLDEVPRDVMNEIKNSSRETANNITNTYKRELGNKIDDLKDSHSSLSDTEHEAKATKDLKAWYKERMKYKGEQIGDFEAGQSWNTGLFAHDQKYAKETQYIVLPIATNHEECAMIIAGAPYTFEEIPDDLPLHPNCPHRYYAIEPK